MYNVYTCTACYNYPCLYIVFVYVPWYMTYTCIILNFLLQFVFITCLNVLFRQRKKQGMLESISGIVFGQKMDAYTSNELLSEIFFAECNMLLSLLTFFQVMFKLNVIVLS